MRRPDSYLQNLSNKTCKFGVGGEWPAWPASWVSMGASIRLLGVMCFWEIFSGAAGLTAAFMEAGWKVGPPIDILYDPNYDLLNPIFLGIYFGLIFEKRIRMLHVGPPCSFPWPATAAWQPP